MTDPDTGTLPLLGAAFASGRVWRDHLDVAVRAVERIPRRMLSTVAPDGLSGWQRVDACVTDHALRFPPSDTAVLLQYLLDVLDPDGTERRDAEAFARRRCHASFDPTGMLHGTFLLDPEAGLAFEAVMALLSAPRPVTTTVTADGEIVEIRDPRDKGQRQADALATLCHDFLARHADRARPASGDLRAGEMQAGEMRAGEMRAGEMRAGEAGVGEEGAGKADAGEAGAGEAGAGEAGAGEAPAGQTRDAQAPAPRTQPRDEPPESAAAARAADVAPAMPPPVSRPEDRTVSGSAGVGSADVGSAGDPPTSAEAAGPRSGGVYFGRAPTVILITATAEQVAGAPAVGLATGSLSGHPVSRGTLRRLSCDAALQRVLLSPGGAVLDLGRTVRLASAAQRRAITARDGHCLVAGCRTPVALCDLHHVRHWADGGRTDLENLAPLCPRHHTAVHAGEWQVVLRDGLPWVVPPPWLDPQRRPVRNPLADAVQDVLRTGQAINHAHADRHAPPRLTCDDPDMRSSRSAA